jgi:hypothetical protein
MHLALSQKLVVSHQHKPKVLLAMLNFTAEDFNAIGKGGLFYLFQSLSAFHGYVSRMRALFVEAAFMTALSVDELADDMKLDGENNDQMDIYAILGAAISMAELATGSNPAAAGALTFLGGFVGVMGEIDKPCVTLYRSLSTLFSFADLDLIFRQDPAKLGDAGKIAMNAMIKSMTTEATYQIDKIIAAVFGKQDSSQDDIPMSMRVGGVKNPAVQVFGHGVWLQDQPNNGLPQWAGTIGKQMVRR